MIITFCGHSQYLPSQEDEQKLLSLLTELVGDRPAELYLGGYGAFDAFARACGRKYQETHPLTRLIFVTPYLTAEYQRNQLEHQKELYDEILYPPLEDKPLRFAISYRNKWMVEQADCVIAHVTHTFGGAYQTYQYAKKKQKKIFNLTKKEL